MTLTKGRRLGPYEVLGPIGAGGMGEVYRAHDSRLDRTVAVKILPAHLSDRPQLRQRFEREAKTIASLNHPHICVLHDIGQEDGIDFLVMEYLEGETLANLLAKEPLSLDQTLRYAREIADALDKAHRQGITHRDLKPANIMITKTGTKLLDFGLATRAEPAGPGPFSEMATDAALTVEGTLLGTVQYMSPEQLEGREADARSDIFAFGAVLYEMVTGTKAFEGGSPVSLMAAILHKEPRPMVALQPITPPTFERFVKVCLAKDPDDRWQTARDLVREIQWVSETGTASSANQPGNPVRIPLLKFGLLTVLVLAVVSTAGMALFNRQSPDAVPLWLSVPSPKAGFSVTPALTVSPDGKQIVFAAISASGANSLWVRALGSSNARELPGTDGGLMPFWKPDGRAIGFYANESLQTIEIDGGVPQVLAKAPQGIGGSWNSEGTIIFAPAQNTGLFKIPESGGMAVPLRVPDVAKQELFFEWPHFLPDGRHYLYLAVNSDGQRLYVGSLDSADTKPITDLSSRAEYAAGYLFYGKGAELFAQPFDLGQMVLSRDAVRVASGLGWAGGGNPRNRGFSASSAGVLAYTSQAFAPTSQLTWYERSGAPSGSAGDTGNYFGFVVAKDQKKVVLAQSDTQTALVNLSQFELPDGVPLSLTMGVTPLFGPDSERILYWSPRSKAGFEIFRLNTGKSEPLNATVPGPSGAAFLQSWSSSGQYLVWTASADGIQDDLWMMDLKGDRKPLPFLPSPFNEIQGRISPDGRSIAYVADESGRNEVYIDSFPNTGNKKRVSPGGGSSPEWRPDGKELYYLEPFSGQRQKLMAAPMTLSGTNSTPSRSQTLFVTPAMSHNSYFRQYAAFGAGERFLLNTLVEDNQSREIRLVLNWPALMTQP